MARFPFDLSGLLTPYRLLGGDALTGGVDVAQGVLAVRFGLLRLRTPLRNVTGAEVTGPYNPLKSLGVHLSLADAGLALGTSTGPGVCISFERPVATSGLGAIPLLRHPGLTVTVADPDGLRDAILRERDRLRADEDALLAREDALLAREDAVRDAIPTDLVLDERAPGERAPVVDHAPPTPVALPPARQAAARKVPATKRAPRRAAVRRLPERERPVVADQPAARRPAGNLPVDQTPDPADLTGLEKVAAASGLPVERPLDGDPQPDEGTGR